MTSSLRVVNFYNYQELSKDMDNSLCSDQRMPLVSFNTSGPDGLLHVGHLLSMPPMVLRKSVETDRASRYLRLSMVCLAASRGVIGFSEMGQIFVA